MNGVVVICGITAGAFEDYTGTTRVLIKEIFVLLEWANLALGALSTDRLYRKLCPGRRSSMTL